SPEQKCSPSPASTTALMPSGRPAKNISMPSTVGSSMALRFSARARNRMAMSSRRSALSERGSCRSKPLPDDLPALTTIPQVHPEHDPEKWRPVFGKDHAPPISPRSVTFLPKPVKRSHHLVDIEPHRELLARAGAERQNPIEPDQRRIGGLEP